jgi:hypothetical protein
LFVSVIAAAPTAAVNYSGCPLLPASFGHGNFSGGSGDGSDDPSDTGKQEGEAGAVGILPKENKRKSCPQPTSEQGHADDSCNQRHDHTFLVRDQSIVTHHRAAERPS